MGYKRIWVQYILYGFGHIRNRTETSQYTLPILRLPHCKWVGHKDTRPAEAALAMYGT